MRNLIGSQGFARAFLQEESVIAEDSVSASAIASTTKGGLDGDGLEGANVGAVGGDGDKIITTSLVVMTKASLERGTVARAKANEPPKDGPMWGFFATTFFNFNAAPLRATLFQLIIFNESKNTFMSVKSRIEKLDHYKQARDGEFKETYPKCSLG